MPATLTNQRAEFASIAAMRAFAQRACAVLTSAEAVELFREAAKWTRQGDKWRSSGGRVLSDAAYQKILQRAAERKANPPAARTPAAPRGPRQPQTLATADNAALKEHFQKVMGGQLEIVAAGVPASAEPRPGPSVLGVAGRAAAAVARRIKSAPAAIGAKSAKAGAWASGGVASIGAKAKRLQKLERRFGLGNAIEKSAKRMVARNRAIERVFREEGLLAGAKQSVREAMRALGTTWKESRRRYGFLPAVAIEGAMLGFSWVAKGALFATLGAAAATHIPGLGKALSTALKYVKYVVTPIVRKGVESPFRLGAKLLSGTSRNLAAAGRLAQQMDSRRMVAGPSPVIGRARDIRRGAGPGDLIPEAGGTSRSRRFTEGDELDPREMVAMLRGQINAFRASIGQPPMDATDDQLGDVLSQVMDSIEATATEPRAETFAEYRKAGVPESSLRLAESLGWRFAE